MTLIQVLILVVIVVLVFFWFKMRKGSGGENVAGPGETEQPPQEMPMSSVASEDQMVEGGQETEQENQNLNQ